MSASRFKVLAGGAHSAHNLEGVDKLGTFILTNPKYAQEGALVLCENLKKHMKPSEQVSFSKSIVAGPIMLAANTLTWLLTPSFYEYSAVKEVVETRWSAICEWLDIVAQYTVWIEDPWLHKNQKTCLTALEFGLGLAVTEQSLWDEEGIIPPAVHLWRGATDNPSLQNALQDFRRLEGACLGCLLILAIPVKEHSDQPLLSYTLTELMRKHASLFASVAVRHLGYLIRAADAHSGKGQSYTSRHGITKMAMELSVRLCRVPEFCSAISYEQLVPQTSFLLSMIAQEPFDSAEAADIGEHLIACVKVYLFASMNLTGRRWITKAIVDDLFDNIVGMLPWLEQVIKHEDNSLKSLVNDFITKHVTPFMLYSTVLNVAQPKMDKILSTSFGRSSDFATIIPAWKQLQSAIFENGMVLQTIQFRCGSVKCQTSLDSSLLKQCNGCLNAVYCSRPCQKYDWKRGGHRYVCFDIQHRRSASDISWLPLQTKERLLMEHIVDGIITSRRDELAAHLSKYNQAQAPAIRVSFHSGKHATVVTRDELDEDEVRLLCRAPQKSIEQGVPVVVHLPVGPSLYCEVVYYDRTLRSKIVRV